MRVQKRNWSDWCAVYAKVAVFGYIVLSAAVPYRYGGILALLVVTALVAVLLRRPEVPGVAWGWVSALVALGVYGTALGWVNGNMGAVPQMTIFVVEPAVIGLLFGLWHTLPGHRQWLVRSFDAALIAVAVLGLALYGARAGGGSLPPWLVFPPHSVVDLTGNTLATNFQGYNSMIFLGGYGIYRAMTSGTSLSATWRTLLYFGGISGVVLSGRSVLYLVVPAATLLGLVAFARRPRRLPSLLRLAKETGPLVVAFSVLAGVIWVFGMTLSPDRSMTPNEVVDRTTSQATASTVDESGVRRPQAAKLTHEWLESPVFGHGTGHTIEGYERNATTPWTFELSYHVLLMGFGALGCAVLLAWVVWMSWKLLMRGRQEDLLARYLLVGLAGAVAAAATNPYLFKIDAMWMVFAPFALAVGSVRSNEGHGGSDGA